MRILPVIASIVTAAALTVPAAAQSPDDAPRPLAGQVSAKRGHKIQKGPSISRALHGIGVDDARVQQIVAIHQKYAREHQRVRVNGKQHRDALKSLIEKDSRDEAAYQRALDGLEEARKEQIRLRDAERKEVRNILKPSEQAKLLAQKHRRGPRANPGTTGPRTGQPVGRPRSGERALGPRPRARSNDWLGHRGAAGPGPSH